jgi:hypothetical protein
MNQYVKELSPDTIVTVIAFDSNDHRQIVRDHVRADAYRSIHVDEVKARGMTPLFDATGWIIDKIFEDNPSRAVLIIQTDGKENQSREYKYTDIIAKVDRFKGKEYQLIFLGAEFKNVGTVGMSFGLSSNATIINRMPGYYSATASTLAGATQSYAASGAPMNFSDGLKRSLGDTDTIVVKPTPSSNNATSTSKSA